MTRAISLFAAVTMLSATVQAEPPATDSVDNRLMSVCAARTDARMESMTLGKLEQIRNFEFSLRMAMAQLAAGAEAMTPQEWQLANSKLSQARNDLAQVCGVMVPAQG